MQKLKAIPNKALSLQQKQLLSITTTMEWSGNHLTTQKSVFYSTLKQENN